MRIRDLLSTQNLIRLFDREIKWAVASQALSSGANFATAIILIRYAGITEFGRFSIAFLAMMMARNFLIGSVLAPMSSIGPKLQRTTHRAYKGFLLANALVFAVVSSVLMCLLFATIALAFDIPWLLKLSVVAAIANFFANWSDFLRRQQFVVERADRAFLIDLIRYAVQLGALLGLGEAITLWRLDGITALSALAAGAALSSVYGAVAFGSWCWRKGLSSSVWPRHWAFVRWMLPGVALDTIQSMIPQFAVTALLGESALGLVRALQQIANLLNLPFNALQQTLPSRAANKLRVSGFVPMAQYLRSIGLALGLASALAGMAVVLGRDFVFTLLAIEGSTKATAVIIGYMTLNVLITMRFADQVLVNAVEDPRANFWLGIAGAISSCAFTIILLPVISEVAVPYVGVANAVTTWTFLLIWIRFRKADYSSSNDRRAGHRLSD